MNRRSLFKNLFFTMTISVLSKLNLNTEKEDMITTPQNNDLGYNTNDNIIYVFDGNKWIKQ